MKSFLDSNFLLQSETAQKLYHEHAAKMPIIDYHCHLIPQQIADNYQFADLKNGLKPCSMPCATLYITGPILN